MLNCLHLIKALYQLHELRSGSLAEADRSTLPDSIRAVIVNNYRVLIMSSSEVMHSEIGIFDQKI